MRHPLRLVAFFALLGSAVVASALTTASCGDSLSVAPQNPDATGDGAPPIDSGGPSAPGAGVCAGAEVDVLIDSKNCGRCGRTCASDRCVNGACVAKVAISGRGAVRGISVDDQHLAYSDFIGGAFAADIATDGTVSNEHRLGREKSVSIALINNGSEVVWSLFDAKTLLRAPISCATEGDDCGKNILIAPSGYGGVVAVNGLRAAWVWVETANNERMHVELLDLGVATSDPVSLGSLSLSVSSNDSAVFGTPTKLYFGGRSNGVQVLTASCLDASAAQPGSAVCRESLSVTESGVAADENQIYFVDGPLRELRSVKASDFSDAKTLARVGDKVFAGVHRKDSELYWAEWLPDGAGSVIKRIKTDGTCDPEATACPETILFIDKANAHSIGVTSKHVFATASGEPENGTGQVVVGPR